MTRNARVDCLFPTPPPGLLAPALALLAGIAGCSSSTQLDTRDPIELSSSVRLEPEAPQGDDGSSLREAVTKMDEGDLRGAVELLEGLRRKHPRNLVVLHELALAYRMAGDPEAAVLVLLPHESVLPAMTLASLGSALDDAGQATEAVRVLKRGIDRLPSHGILYSDLGSTLAGQGKLLSAIKMFEAGIQADPTWPSNYWHAAKLFALGDNTAQALLYTETFRLLEPNTQRSEAAAQFIEQLYRGSARSVDAHQWEVSLAPDDTRAPHAGVPLANAFEQAFGPQLVAAHREGINLGTLHKARQGFQAQWWMQDGPGGHYDSPVLELQRDLHKLGLLEAYDHWLLSPAYPGEAQAYASAHADQWAESVQYVDSRAFRNDLERW